MLDADRPVPLGQEANLDQIADHLAAALDVLPAFDAGLALSAAGLDVLPAARCTTHYREVLHRVRDEIDRLLAQGVQ